MDCNSCCCCTITLSVVQLEPLKHFTQAVVDLGTAYGRVPASHFIVGYHTVRSDIVKQFHQVQETLRELIAALSKLGAVSFANDLRSDNVVQHSYLDVTFLGAGNWSR